MRRRQRKGRAPRGGCRIAAAVAAAAVLLVVAGSLANAALDAVGQRASQDASSAQAEAQTQGAQADASPGSDDSGEESPSASDAQGPASQVMDVLRSHSWQAQGDSSKTLRFREDSLIESGGQSSRVVSFEVGDGQWDGSAGSVELRVTADGAQDQPVVVSLTGSESSYSVSCDAFSLAGQYVQGARGEGPVSVTGVTEPYTSLVDGKTDELASTVAAWCRDHVPTATSASFDGEVYVDVPSGTVTATFTCDDASATVISVVYSGGSFEVRG